MSDFEEFERKLGVLVEHMNDQFERVLEAIDSKTAALPEIQKKLQKVSDRVEVIESEVKYQNLTTQSIKNDTKMLKLRSDKAIDANDGVHAEVVTIEKRLSKLETA